VKHLGSASGGLIIYMANGGEIVGVIVIVGLEIGMAAIIAIWY